MPAPGEIIWNDKNVMPYFFQEDLPGDRDVVLLTDVERKDGVRMTVETLSQELSGTWEQIGETGNGEQIFLRRAADGPQGEEMGR